MKFALLLSCLVVLAIVCSAEKKSGLQIGVKKRPETCDIRSKKGDKLSMHYTVSCRTLLGFSLARLAMPGNATHASNIIGNIGRWNRI